MEILNNGMVVTDWRSPKYVKTYKSGILAQEGQEEEGLPNHASVIVGWGEENDKKYWIVRNSFGEDFGMKGDMKIPRGQNTFSIESDILGFTPEFI